MASFEQKTILEKVLSTMKCYACGQGQATDSKLRDREANKLLKQWRKEEQRILKLLLLGIGESGKSTLTKQMKIIHIDGFNESEKLEQIPDIRRNLKDAILILLGAMNNLGISLSDSSLEEAKEYILTEATADNFAHTQIFYDYVKQLWQDPGVKECYQRSNEYQLFDSAQYFLDRVDLLRREDYIPSEQDLLRCRVMTNSIHQINFKVMDKKTEVKFSVFDVGGQQGERRKWIQVFDLTTAILFVVDCSCFDQVLREDAGTNRFIESMETFEQVWNNRWLRNVDVMVFLNKIDLLEEKVKQGRSMRTLIDSISPDHHYHQLLNMYSTFTKLRDGQRREFIEAFPRTTDSSTQLHQSNELNHQSNESEISHRSDANVKSSSKSRRGSRKRSSNPSILNGGADINEESIHTAVFIKNIFMNLMSNPIMYKQTPNWHSLHSCEFFYTCAVDTDTVKKVLDGCRSLIVKKILDRWGM